MLHELLVVPVGRGIGRRSRCACWSGWFDYHFVCFDGRLRTGVLSCLLDVASAAALGVLAGPDGSDPPLQYALVMAVVRMTPRVLVGAARRSGAALRGCRARLAYHGGL